MTWDKNKYKDFKVIKLKRRGPKDGQSVDAYVYGKTKGYEELIFDPKTKFNDLESKWVNKDINQQKKKWKNFDKKREEK
tara:strand:- start:1170 stop:1406 length:237 start_codon:yes stop_codon:yes gene_type:complete